MVERNYRGTTIAEIARRADVHVDTVYELVGRKPVVLRELIEQAISGTDRAVVAEDRAYVKARASAFFPGHCDLASMLHDRDINTVLVAGTVANVCCESTARDARTLGYRVIMIADANAALRDQDLNATLHTIYRSFGDVRPTSDVIAMIEASNEQVPTG